MPTGTMALERRLPTHRDRETANQLRRILATHEVEGRDRTIKVADDQGRTAEVVLTGDVADLLLELLRVIGKGDAVTLVPVSQMLTTQQAADLLNVSRPHLIAMLEREHIPHDRVGRHRRIRADDLFAYMRRRDEERAAALDELGEMDAELL